MALSDITPIKRSEEYLQRIADAIENSGGSDLPAVTSDDNGDVLTVVNGAWDKAAPSGGGGLPKIHMTGSLQPSLVSTYDEILAIHQTGSAAVLYDDDNSLDVLVLYPTPEIVQPAGTVRGYAGVIVNGFRNNSTSATITTYDITLGDDGTTQDAILTKVIKTVALSGGIG